MNLATFVNTTHADRAGEGIGKDVGEDDIVAALRQPAFSESDKTRVAALASKLLVETASNRIRNAAAIFLADHAGARLKDLLLPLLRRPDLAQSSGSLLFALSEVKETLPLDILLSIVEHGSFEAQAEALTFMEEERVDPFTSDDDNAARLRLAAICRQRADATRAEAAALALEYLDDLRSGP